MATVSNIDLAHEPAIRIGTLTIRPAIRQLADDDGAQETLEPRVMQVLTALAKARGAVLTREELTETCWEGRIVGNDAINRVISRLRRVASGIAANSFQIETIAKVGYRLVPLDAADPPLRGAPTTRRRMLAGTVAATALAVAGLGTWSMNRRREPAPAEALSLMAMGRAALRQGDPENNAQAIGLFRRAVALAPRDADAWGLLAVSCALGAKGHGLGPAPGLRLKAEDAARHATAIDPHNALAAHASIVLIAARNHWAEVDRKYLDALRFHPDSEDLQFGYGLRLAAVGRLRDSAQHMGKAVAKAEPSVSTLYAFAGALWSDGQLADADRTIERALELFPLNFAVWFTRFYLLLFTGRADQALRFGANLDGRPRGIEAANFQMIMDVAGAFATRRPASVQHAVDVSLASAHLGSGFAENAMQFTAALGNVDAAFEVAAAYFFGRGFKVPSRRFSQLQGAWTDREDRRTNYLFLPSTANMRTDPRFKPLVEELGLRRYWRIAGISPDYE